MKTQMQIDIAIDELFGNIASYAYSPDTGKATVRVEDTENTSRRGDYLYRQRRALRPSCKGRAPILRFPRRSGQIGGLGIYMVKKTMDDISYEYKEGQNILKIRKEIR